MIRDDIYDYLKSELSDTSNLVSEAAKYVVLGERNSKKGHFWRPILAINVAEMYGAFRDEIMPVAVGLELGHTASLILDDLPSMDNSGHRRGRPSCHIKYGEAVTELCSHYLLGKADLLTVNNDRISSDKCRNVLRESKKTLLNLIQGQEIDLFECNNGINDLRINGFGDKEFNKIIKTYALKTGVLYGAAAAIGGIIGDASEEDIKKLRNFGNGLGVVYQIGDDLCDVLANSRDLGKPVNQDRDKKTLINLIGINKTNKYRNDLFNKIKDSLEDISSNTVVLDNFADELCSSHDRLIYKNHLY
jgi:geranylgeranyl diphosphate synthase type II|tara:strand:- start:322 stop:1233 length:912 start_codon:yes stop_codon:yes gene_type:complete